MTNSSTHNLRGTIFALLGGICWGLSGACGQYLFGNYGSDPVWIATMRMTFAGIILLLVCLFKRDWRHSIIEIWKHPKDIALLLAFALLGLAFCQISYLMAIRYSNAGTATVLQYIGPVLVVVLMCLKKKRLPAVKEFIAVLCVVVGTFLTATHGNFTSLALSPLGLTWGLIAAVSLVFYTLIPVGIMERHGSIPVLAMGSFIGGIVCCVFVRPWSTGTPMGIDGWLCLSGLILSGAVLGFSFYLQSVVDIGAAKTSLIASVETVSATAFAVLWLGTAFTLIDLIGFVFIMSTVFLLYKPDPKPGQSEPPALDEGGLG